MNILVVDGEVNIRRTLVVCLETEGHRRTAVSNFQDALTEAATRSFDLALVDLRLGTENGLDLIPALLTQTPWLKAKRNLMSYPKNVSELFPDYFALKSSYQDCSLSRRPPSRVTSSL